MDWLNEVAQNQEAPAIAAFALGLLTAIAPCPLATNITATAFIAKSIKSKKKVILSGFLYTLGRMFSYTTVASLIYFGSSKFKIANLLQGQGEKYIGFILVLLGLIMLELIKFNFINFNFATQKVIDAIKTKGLISSFLLGALFALAFCPYSGALFFGILLPMTVQSGLSLPIAFSLGTGIPVILFALIIAFSLQKLGYYFNAITKIEKIVRIASGMIFILTGIYYIHIFFNILKI